MHVYAALAEFKAFLSGGDVGTDRDAAMLTTLESASRAVDGFCNRGSEFGPTIETRTYLCASDPLYLSADLLEITTLTVDDDTESPTALTARTRILRDYTGDIEIAGTWGYDHDVVALTALAGDMADDASTLTVTTGQGVLVSPGHTLVIEDEQLYVLSVATDTATVIRGANGTTAAAHTTADPVSYIRYTAAATDAVLRVALRRWKQRDAGLTGAFGGVQVGGGVPMTTNIDSERSILYSAVGHLRFELVA